MTVQLEGFEAIVFTLIVLFIILIIPVSIISFILSILHNKRIRQKHLSSSVVKAEYEPPGGLSPAEIGYLFDSRSGVRESTATILDLEQRGFIRINKTTDGLFNIHRTDNSPTDLKPHEKLIIDSISALKNIDIEDSILLFGFNKAIRQSLKNSGFISPATNLIGYYLGKALVIYLSVNLVLFIWFMFLSKGDVVALLLSSFLVFILCFPIFFALALAAAYINNLIAGHSGILNKQSKKIWPEIEGYREYIRQVEIDEIRFESEELKIKSKNKALPYAVALGFNTKWHERSF